MALRALDNTLPAAVEERPKKVAKVAVASAVLVASPGSGKRKKKNDENSAPKATAAAGEQAVEYIPSEELEAVTNPKAKAAGLVAKLDSKDWVEVCDALNDARRLAIHHSALLNPISIRGQIEQREGYAGDCEDDEEPAQRGAEDVHHGLHRHLQLLRQPPLLCLRRGLRQAGTNLQLFQLLLKASQDKKFVCEEAEKAMRAMAASMPPLPLLKKLKAYVRHANLRVRAKAAVAIAHCASRMDIEAMKEFGMSALLKVAADLLNDRLPEAREAARSVVGSVHAAFAKEAVVTEEDDGLTAAASWESLCSLSLPPISAQAVAKIASSSSQ